MSNRSDNGDSKYSSNLSQQSQPKLYYRNLSSDAITGQIWNNNLVSSLFDVKIVLIPVIHAAAPENVPKRPPPMRYKDLPITESNEFYKYHTYLEEKAKCPGQDDKLLQTYLCPKVHQFRTAIGESVFGVTHELCLMKSEVCAEASKNIRCFKKFMRHPDNLLIRRVVLVLSTLTGMYIGSGTRGITRKLFFGTLGALAAGALCFPKETDVVVRNASYHIVKLFFALYNSMCDKHTGLRERVPCADDLPPPPPKRESHQINKECEDEKARAQAKAKAALIAKAKEAARAALGESCPDK